jgi:hypothetical protein
MNLANDATTTVNNGRCVGLSAVAHPQAVADQQLVSVPVALMDTTAIVIKTLFIA